MSTESQINEDQDPDLRTLDIEQIMALIPHRFPMLLVDRVEQLDRGRAAVGIKNVTINDPFFEGHFPGKPVMPGVLIIEALAQTAGVVAMDAELEEGATSLIYFMTIQDARFRQPVVPGDRLELCVRKERARRNVWRFGAEAKVDGAVVAEATFTAMFVTEPAK
jgi:3-hydroxyacyl-[acyl-carrier-protein] dehydratase